MKVSHNKTIHESEQRKKVKDLKYLGATVLRNCGKEVKNCVQAGWNGWKKVLAVI